MKIARLDLCFVLYAAAAASASAAAGLECTASLAEAQRLLAAQNLPAALAAVTRCLAVEPLNSPARLLKGNLQYLSGRDGDAIETLQDLVRREPANWDARYALGRVYYFNDRPDPACAQFEAIIAAQPANYRAWDNLGLAREAAGLIPQAIQAHVRAISLVSKDHPEYDWAHANLAELLMKQDDNRKAFDLAVEAAQRNPNGARNYFLAGKALTRLDQWAKSERWFRKAAELDETYPTPHYFLAQVYRRLGRPEDAERERKIFKDLHDKAPDKKR